MKFKFLSLLPLITLFGLTSCNNNTDPYKDKIVKDSTSIITTGDIVREYDVSETKASININDLKVFYPDDKTELTYFAKDEGEIPDKSYFITRSNTAPTQYRLKPSDKMSTSNKEFKTNVYIATIDYKQDKVHLSKAIEITLKNSKALNPILYYVGGAFIIVAVAAMVYFTKRYKETHPSK